MSRTDKTDPMWVRIADPANRRETKVVHDHRHGPCDLHTWKPVMARRSLWHHKERRCFIRPRPFNRLWCNCFSCRGHVWNDWNGYSRAEWRAQRQAWLAGWGEYRKERGARKYWYD